MPFTPITELITAEMHVPLQDELDPEISIVIPALNEQLTVGEFVDWCHEGIAKAGIRGEIIIVDSSTDDTPSIALEHGARVLRIQKRGLGRAYIDAIPFVRGQYVIMGDADCTYDFRDINPFLDAWRSGSEFVMGSRYKGSIEKGAMPFLHQYFGTPLTTSLLNRLFGMHFSDIHCGMRAATKDALIRMELSVDGWEYSSEMILKALHLKLRVSEVPIHFYKDRNGRVSHYQRMKAFSDWKAGWETLRVLFVNGADFFLFRPGVFFALLGLFGVAFLATGPQAIGPITLTLHAESLFLTLTVIGFLCLFMGIVARCLYDQTPDTALRWQERFSYNRVTITSFVLALVGLVIECVFVVVYIHHDYHVDSDMQTISHLSIAGLCLLITSMTLFVGTLIIHAVAEVKLKYGRRRSELRLQEAEPVGV